MRLLIALCVAVMSLCFPCITEAAVQGFTIQPTEQLPQVVVKENFIQLATMKLESELREKGETRRYDIQAVRVPAGIRLPAGHISYDVFLPNGISIGRKTQVWINISVNGKYFSKITCVMQVHLYESMVVSSRQIRPEIPLKADDVTVEERELGYSSFTYYTDISQVVGKVLSKPVTRGTILYTNIVKEPIMVEFGVPVTIKGNINGVEVSVEGITQNRGRLGEWINVKNTSSGKIIRAKVLDENTVSIEK